MNLPERLRQLRTARDLRLVDIAAATALSVPYISDMERGRAAPSLDALGRLAVAYALTLPELLKGVAFTGQLTGAGRPLALQSLLDDPTFGPQITPEWATLLTAVEFRGRRPRGKDDYLTLFLLLRRVLA